MQMNEIRPLRRRSVAGFLAVFGLMVASFWPAPVLAQIPYRIILGFPAGGTIDVTARILADAMRADLDAPIIVEARPGAGGLLAAQFVKNAQPDGRTLLLTPDHTMVMIPLTMKSPGFAPGADFAPIGQVARYAGGFAVASSIRATDIESFLTWAKANPDKANIGIPAAGSVPQFMVHVLGQQSKSALTVVPYRGSQPLVQDLLGSQIPAGITALGDFTEQHAAGQMRVIATLGSRRSAALPDVATLAEQGYKIEWEFWLGMFAPAGTPADTVQRLNLALGKALAQPGVRESMTKIAFEPATGAPQDLANLVATGIMQWGPIVRDSGWVLQ